MDDVHAGAGVELGVLQALCGIELAVRGGCVVEDLGERAGDVVVVVEDLIVIATEAVVSFGEDNAGNLYVVDFGGTRGDVGFGADYPNAGRGQIFMLVPVPERNKPQRVPLQFPSLSAAEGWMHSPEGKDQIAEILESAGKD